MYAHKWWDYKRLSPGHSFMLFAHHYYSAFKVSARKMLIHKKNDKRTTALWGAAEVQFDPDSLWERHQSHITGMWNAMLTADALGMPYNLFCRLAFEIAIERCWTRLPKPSQLYTEKIAARAVQAWDVLRGERLMSAQHPLYLVENYGGSQVQDAYREWVLEELKGLDSPLNALTQVVYRKPQLPVAMVQPHFPAPLLNRARLLAS